MQNASAFSVDRRLEQLLGKRFREPVYSWSISLVYCVILVTGLTGNLCTLWVITKIKKMHTATNCYLFSLAISDTLTLLLGMPPEFYLVWVQYPWPFGRAYCVLKSFTSEVTSYASVLTILLFTTERWLAICYPMKSQLIAGVSRSIKILMGVWVTALVCAAPYAHITRAFYAVEYPRDCNPPNVTSFKSADENFSRPCVEYPKANTSDPAPHGPIAESLTCSIPLEFAQLGNILLQCSTGVFFVAPMVIITVLYARIAITLSGSDSIFAKNPTEMRAIKGAVVLSLQGVVTPASKASRRRRNGNGYRSSVHKECSSSGGHTRKAALRILIAVVIVFFFSYAPYHLQRVISVHHDSIPSAIDILDYLYQFSAVFYYVSSAVNPILYNVASKRFRRAFMQVVCKCNGKQDSFKLATASQSTVLQRQPSSFERQHTIRSPDRSAKQSDPIERTSPTRGPLDPSPPDPPTSLTPLTPSGPPGPRLWSSPDPSTSMTPVDPLGGPVLSDGSNCTDLYLIADGTLERHVACSLDQLEKLLNSQVTLV